ncbi:unnamed protein product [Auanema sp. JU1783]|nr:unnamed protein product [Auanema sp. JU1783]
MIGSQIPSLLSFPVTSSTDRFNFHSKRLFIGDLPKDLSAIDVKENLQKYFKSAKAIEVYSDLCLDYPNNRGFAFLSYDSHEEAKEVRQKLRLEKPKFLGQSITCDWAQEEQFVPDDVMKNVRVLFVRNVNKTVSEDELKEHFGGSKMGVTKVKIQKNFAFVHFETRESAESSLKRLNGQLLHGHELEVQWSKPQPSKPIRSSHGINSFHGTANGPYNIPNRALGPIANAQGGHVTPFNVLPHNLHNLTIPQTLPLMNYACVPPVTFLPNTADVTGNILWLMLKKACTDVGYHIPMICTVVFNFYRPLLEQQFKSSLVLPTGEQYHSQLHNSQLEAENEVIVEAYREISRDITHHLFGGVLQMK